MKEVNLFNENYIDLLCPYYVEYLWSITSKLEENNETNIREKTLEIISQLLDLQIVYVGDEWLDPTTLKKWELSNEAIIDRIKKKWFIGAQFPDLYEIAAFGYKEWYINSLAKADFQKAKNWKTFVSTNIGDLESWIQFNRP